MKPFDHNLLIDTFQSITEPVILNPDSNEEMYSINAIVTNAPFNEDSAYHIHSVDVFKCGDCFKMDDKYYLVTSDVGKRGIKYKGIADYCNFSVPIYIETKILKGKDHLGRPVYEIIKELVGYNVGVAKQESMTILNSSGIVVPYTKMTLTIRDNTANRDMYILNYQIQFEGKSWRVIDRDFTKKGIIQLRLDNV